MAKQKRKYTKYALTLSIMLLMLWGLLGTGTTIAWFSDTSEAKNTFFIGDLDLVVSHKLEDGTYEEIKSDTSVFDDEALYEPGYVQVVYLKAENKGDVPFEYKLAVEVDDVTVAKGMLGNDIYLPEYLKYGALFGADEAKLSRETAKIIAENDFPEEVSGYPLNVYSEKDDVVLEPGDERYVAIIVRMPENIGNVANYRGTTVPRVDLGITVTASQEGTLK